MTISGSNTSGTQSAGNTWGLTGNTQLNDLLTALLSQLAPTAATFQQQYQQTGQDIAANTALQGIQASNLSTNTGLQQQQIDLSNLSNQQQQAYFNAAQNALNPSSIANQLFASTYGPTNQGGYLGYQQGQAVRGAQAGQAAQGEVNTQGYAQNLQDIAANYGYQRQQAGLGQQQNILQSIMQSQAFQNTARANNISTQQLANQFTQGMASIGVQGEQNYNQLLGALGQDFTQLPQATQQIVNAAATAGGIPGPWATSAGK